MLKGSFHYINGNGNYVLNGEFPQHQIIGNNIVRIGRFEKLKRYKELIKEYHPDRLQGMGLPKEFIELANKKLIAINKAYNDIKNEK